jgi:N-acetylglucosaminyldiphosphoundecaprenol N-acetyl-beta-D-mannosaminyltransferase
MTDTVNILSVNISKRNLGETTDLLSKWIDEKQKKRLCVTPVNCVLWAYRDVNLRKIYNTSDLNKIIWSKNSRKSNRT